MELTRSQLRHSKSDTSSDRRTKSLVSADYIVGLTDGEGCFYVLVKPPFNHEGGAVVQLSFFIKVQERDREVLEKVKDVLGCGAVYFQPETRPNHSQCYRYTVNSHRDVLNVIIPFFKKHPLQTDSKRNNFEIFCAVARLVSIGAHHTSKGIRQLMALKAQMNQRTRVTREIRTLRGNMK